MTTEPTATKTLEATLAPPTAHKERRLQRTVATYRRALEDAFESGANTPSAVNDIVTPYTLPPTRRMRSRATCRNCAIPMTLRTRRQPPGPIHEPRLLSRSPEDRRHEFCWRVPQAGRGNAFWIPLRINPEQRDSGADLFDGEPVGW